METSDSGAVPAVPPRTSLKDDYAFRRAWQRYIEYSDASNKRRAIHANLRRLVILLTFFMTVYSTLIAIVSGIPDPNYITAGNIFGVILLIISASATGLTVYMLQFMPSQGWIAYRYGAEQMKREIALYRMKMGVYRGKTLAEARKLLNDIIDRIPNDPQFRGQRNSQPIAQRFRNTFDAENMPPVETQATAAPSPTMFQKFWLDVRGRAPKPAPRFLEIAVKANVEAPDDDGFSTMNAEDYIRWRVTPQYDWYTAKLNSDHDQFKRWRAFAIAMTMISPVLAGIGLGAFVGIAAAAAVAVALYIDLRMYGRTYSIYQTTVNRIERLRAKWESARNETSEPTFEECCEWVDLMEDVFSDEHNQWIEEAKQSQQTVDQSILRTLNMEEDDASREAAQRAEEGDESARRNAQPPPGDAPPTDTTPGDDQSPNPPAPPDDTLIPPDDLGAVQSVSNVEPISDEMQLDEFDNNDGLPNEDDNDETPNVGELQMQMARTNGR